MADVLTIGEALLRFTPPRHRRFEQSTVIEWHIGGSELNVAVGLARLGLDVTWLSRLPDQVMARQVERTLVTQGVDASQIIWTPHDRLGTYYMEEGIGTRSSHVTYDRANSAMSKMIPDDINIPALLDKPPELFHTSGITMALSASAAQTIDKLVTACQQNAVPISFDFNYRMKLWDPPTARERCQPIMAVARLIFIPARDAALIYGTDKIEDMHNRFPQATIFMTRGSEGSVAITTDGQIFHQGIYPTQTVCRVGGGDAFSAGIIYAYLSGMEMSTVLRYGTAMASLKYSLAGDMPLVLKSDVETLAQEQPLDILR